MRFSIFHDDTYTTRNTHVVYLFVILGMLLRYAALLCVPMGSVFYGFWRLTQLMVPGPMQRLLQAGSMGLALAP